MKIPLAALSWSLASGIANCWNGTLPDPGTYTIRRLPAVPAQAGCIVVGSVFDLVTKHPLKVAVVAFNKTIVTTDTLGHFRYECAAGTYAVHGGFIGFYRVDIPKLKLRAGEQVELTFWVVQDQRPTTN
ncbi:hypothetical protein [Hymenobacter sp. BRD67]|uniref:hypothetical protein n=1 Tax=Hymenobacter sp. BRD67 TaxID=2675877 RepID=UPI001565DF74|nr:hypothetical protein [Hymenobacter sp. BRD67]QKG55038.1 hypothetical protein GKZ67_21680 [Hymenobacter sp. BRD67]